MKYMLIHCIDEAAERSGDPERRVPGAPAIESWIIQMEGRGVLLHGDRLRYVSDATTVRVRDRELLVSDGPFAETKEQIAAVLTARDATMMTGAVAGGGTATIVMSHARHALVFTAADLHALPASRGYELWLIGPAGDRPVTMFQPGRHDMMGPVIASGLKAGDHLALTAEPAGGAARPTAPMMLDVVL